MALTICKDCGRELSTDAKRCPNCGAKKPFHCFVFLNKGCKYTIIGLVLFFALGPIVSKATACSRLRASVRQHDPVAAALSDGLIDVALQAKYGELTPGRCLDVLKGANNQR